MANQTEDTDFIESMHELLGMDKDAVESLLDTLDAEKLQDLTDAVANEDVEAAKKIAGQADTDENSNINDLLRGKNIENKKHNARKFKHADGDTQYGIGDDVMVKIRDKNGKVQRKTGTVVSPHGPEGTDTIIVRVDGKPVPVPRRRVHRLDEGVLGLTSIPSLNRMQKLAGIAAQETSPAALTVAPEAVEMPLGDDPLEEAMAALDTLAAVLPRVTIANAKLIRARLLALQGMLNESRRPRMAEWERKF